MSKYKIEYIKSFTEQERNIPMMHHFFPIGKDFIGVTVNDVDAATYYLVHYDEVTEQFIANYLVESHGISSGWLECSDDTFIIIDHHDGKYIRYSKTGECLWSSTSSNDYELLYFSNYNDNLYGLEVFKSYERDQNIRIRNIDTNKVILKTKFDQMITHFMFNSQGDIYISTVVRTPLGQEDDYFRCQSNLHCIGSDGADLFDKLTYQNLLFPECEIRFLVRRSNIYVMISNDDILFLNSTIGQIDIYGPDLVKKQEITMNLVNVSFNTNGYFICFRKKELVYGKLTLEV